MANNAPSGGTSGAPANGSLQSGAAGGSGPKQRLAKPKPGTLVVTGGSRQLKGYTVTGDELLSLGLVQGASSLCFALAGSCFGFWLSVSQSVELTGKDTPATALAKWQAYGDVAFWVGCVLGLAGVGFMIFSGFKVNKIKNGTIHD